ncbi:hypothetical protein JR316_0011383 [Psilocybe cubensis]|uniref:Uncharacterized protein n=1 Tax=Psilocybe cubensis TaxID=181762 RepID=A0ACB8GJM4_PSICU|nr:hypothetical protein JR316_0011383 [Psilocybe cubensis]KAH9475823.1 hypothetical protein JR316_0011383 [Psilocybe cubensis]
MPPTTPSFDWSQGSVFLQDGIIYYSPNCNRPVRIKAPERNHPHPFPERAEPDPTSVKHPVWWTDTFGWMSFIPLNPSFISDPFDTFTWQPELDVTPSYNTPPGPTLYQLEIHTIKHWRFKEQCLLEAAHKMKLWYHVPASQPPPPSIFKYDEPYTSKEEAYRQIKLARDWFAVWMGFFAYFAACAKYDKYCAGKMVREQGELLPRWYTRLLEEVPMLQRSWLDGLLTSPACVFSPDTQRAGIVIPWYEYDNRRPEIQFFLDQQIPVFFPWCAIAEQAIINNPTLRYLEPPANLVWDALEKFLNRFPSVPLAGLILRSYFRFHDRPLHSTKHILRMEHSTSLVTKYMYEKFASQTDKVKAAMEENQVEATVAELREIVSRAMDMDLAEAERAIANLPTHDWMDKGDYHRRGELYDHVSIFLEKRERNQRFIIATETEDAKIKRLQREEALPGYNTSVYRWKSVTTPGGKELYMRVRLLRSKHERLFAKVPPSQRTYNAVSNEWDIFDEVDLPRKYLQFVDPPPRKDGYIYDYPIQAARINPQSIIPDNDVPRVESVPVIPEPCVDSSSGGATSPHEPQYETFPMDTEEFQEGPSQPPVHRPEPGPSTMDTDTDEASKIHDYDWDTADLISNLRYSYGFVASVVPKKEDKTPEGWKHACQHFGFRKDGAEQFVSNTDRQLICQFHDGLMGSTDRPLPQDIHDLHPQNYLSLQVLGNLSLIHRPIPNLFVFAHHDIRAPQEESDRMSADWSIGVETPEAALYVLRVFQSHPGHTVVHQPYKEVTFYRKVSYKFTNDDYESSMLACRQILDQQRGRAALLMGGIVGRIAKEYLSTESVLQGPSVELLRNGRGYVANPEAELLAYCDDGLTEHDIAIIIGSYSLMTDFKNQVGVKSWFPPPAVWNEIDRNGIGWLEWTERNEYWYQTRLELIRNGKAQPLTLQDWKSLLKNKPVRVLRESVRARSAAFVHEHIPVTRNPRR